ncbi:unnamed protein product [Brassica oleracea var. botrytis]|uniref:Uncharacterized protein n=1 Tax=Brassica oleracea TaxID=3712 RepID=A0A3P6CQ17_BRAOL|nr:unnamed protein product [Brassica oleracea]
MEFKVEKGERDGCSSPPPPSLVTTTTIRHRSSLPPSLTGVARTTVTLVITNIARSHNHRHLSHQPSLVTTTITSQIRLHRSRHHNRHAPHNHNRSLPPPPYSEAVSLETLQ